MMPLDKIFLFTLLITVLLSACNKPDDSPLLFVPDDLEVTLWAESPQFFNPTNMDIDIRGRVWVTEAVNYRDFRNADGHKIHSEGDRIVILEDTNGDGVADLSKVFVQDEDLRSPLGIAVVGNKVIVSCAPSIIIYTDEDGDDIPDKKEILLTGFGGRDHDHGLHSGTVGPDGKFYFNVGNAGPHKVKDKDGWTLRSGSVYNEYTPYSTENTPAQVSDDGKVWTGGLALRVNLDGTGLEVMAHNFRNSYEVIVDSFGNLWQNDNDDQVDACRTGWLMEGSNAGFFSNTGERTWQADRRPDQSIATAHWHQNDPGIIPAGDIYGAGSPTGIVLNESDLLGKHYRGLLLSADAGRNIIFGYYPELKGAGYTLSSPEAFISSVEKDNENYRWYETEVNKNKWFRPSDVSIGTDGAIYVADWYDPIVGGHQMYDREAYGRIYRIQPKSVRLKAPEIDLNHTKGQIAALLSPAVNVRYLGFERLKKRGTEVIPAVQRILQGPNPYHRARAIWLLSQLGEKGVAMAEGLLDHVEEKIRLTAFRALRQAAPDKIPEYAKKLVHDASSAVRAEVAIAIHNLPDSVVQPLLFDLIRGYNGRDAWYLYALGNLIRNGDRLNYQEILDQFGEKDPENWSLPLAQLIWEVHPDKAVEDLKKRVLSSKISLDERKKALDALAFIPTSRASDSMRELAEITDAELANSAQWWLQFRKTNDWRAFLEDWETPLHLTPQAFPELASWRKVLLDSSSTREQKQKAGTELARHPDGRLHLIYLVLGENLSEELIKSLEVEMMQEKNRNIKALIGRFFKADTIKNEIEEVVNLETDVSNGKTLTFANCIVCHKIDGAGSEIGPDLTNIHLKYDKFGITEAILHPDAGIAFGSEAYIVTLKNGAAIYGLLLSDGPVVTLMDTFGRKFMIEASEVEGRRRLANSLMPSPQYMQLSNQDVADITAYLLQKDKQNPGNAFTGYHELMGNTDGKND